MSGDIGPFQLAILLTVITLFFIFFWNENYGHDESNFSDENDNGNLEPHSSASPSAIAKQNGASSAKKPTFVQAILNNIHTIAQHPKICLIGFSQACFEGAVFTFGKLHFFQS